MNIFQKTSLGMMRLMVRVMPSCKEVSALVSQGMDARLPLRTRFSVRLHLCLCSICRRYEKQLRLLREGARHYADPDQNPVEQSLSQEAKERLEKALEERAK